LTSLLLRIEIGFFYFGSKNDHKLNLKIMIKTIIKEFLRIVAAFFLGSFGFSIESFDPKEEQSHSLAKD